MGTNSRRCDPLGLALFATLVMGTTAGTSLTPAGHEAVLVDMGGVRIMIPPNQKRRQRIFTLVNGDATNGLWSRGTAEGKSKYHYQEGRFLGDPDAPPPPKHPGVQGISATGVHEVELSARATTRKQKYKDMAHSEVIALIYKMEDEALALLKAGHLVEARGKLEEALMGPGLAFDGRTDYALVLASLSVWDKSLVQLEDAFRYIWSVRNLHLHGALVVNRAKTWIKYAGDIFELGVGAYRKSPQNFTAAQCKEFLRLMMQAVPQLKKMECSGHDVDDGGCLDSWMYDKLYLLITQVEAHQSTIGG